MSEADTALPEGEVQEHVAVHEENVKCEYADIH